MSTATGKYVPSTKVKKSKAISEKPNENSMMDAETTNFAEVPTNIVSNQRPQASSFVSSVASHVQQDSLKVQQLLAEMALGCQDHVKKCSCETCKLKTVDDMSWDLIQSYFEEKGFVKSQINSYNELLFKFIPDVVQRLGQFTFQYNNHEYSYKFLKPKILPPCFIDADDKPVYIKPKECRLRNLDYKAPIYCFIQCESKSNLTNQTKTKIEKILLCNIPVMLKSEICPLQKLSPHQMSQEGECMYDHGGYFILNGSEKVLIAQERMAHNQVFCYFDKAGFFTSELRSVPEGISRAASQVVVYYNVKKTNKFLPAHPILIGLNFLKKEVPLVVVFRALGI